QRRSPLALSDLSNLSHSRISLSTIAAHQAVHPSLLCIKSNVKVRQHCLCDFAAVT
ncbi:hypothetical protein U1Q18_008164, partial [Sarracenia purpurea var. burkii]